MRRITASFGFVALLFAALCAPLVFSDKETNYSQDEAHCHLPAVESLRGQWPKLDLKAYDFSAISPGYHYLLAGLSRVTSSHRTALRLITWGISVAALFLLWRQFAVEHRTVAIASLLPLVCSNFFVKSASWVVTDNPGLLCAIAVLGMVFSSTQKADWRLGVLTGLATFMRQLHFWTVAPAVLGLWRDWRKDRETLRTVIGLSSLVIPVAVLAVLIWQWQGLVPPAWRSFQQGGSGPSFSALCYALAVFATLSPFYLLALAHDNWREALTGKWTLCAAVIGLVFALVVPSWPSYEAGRWGGYLWAAAEKLPLVQGRSIVFIVLVPVGAALLSVFTVQLARRSSQFTALLWLTSYLAWLSTSLPSRLVFHRYFEPMTLVFLILWGALLLRSAPLDTLRCRIGWLGSLVFVQLVITLATAHIAVLGA